MLVTDAVATALTKLGARRHAESHAQGTFPTLAQAMRPTLLPMTVRAQARSAARPRSGSEPCGESTDEDFNPRVVLARANEGQRRSLCWCRINAVSERAGKYARFELERRFLVGRLPEGNADDRRWRISDRYIKNTHLRLRRMEPIHGGEIIFKLGQKHVPSPPDLSRMTITNIYLSPGEYAVLAGLEALELQKVRHSIEHDERIFSVDVFNDHLTGLVLAEVGFETPDEMDQTFGLPPWVIREVSGDIRFTGGALANLAADQAAELIREITTPQP